MIASQVYGITVDEVILFSHYREFMTAWYLNPYFSGSKLSLEFAVVNTMAYIEVGTGALVDSVQ